MSFLPGERLEKLFKSDAHDEPGLQLLGEDLATTRGSWVQKSCRGASFQRVAEMQPFSFVLGAPAGYYLLIRWWIALGVGAFAAVLGLFALMVFRPGL